MAFNFEDLTKIPSEPAARLLANSGMKLETKLDLPAVASVSEYLTALDELGASIDVMRLLAVALPPREAVWWACIAGTDITGDEDENATPSLSAAKAWVYKPDDDSREAVRMAMQNADYDDETVFCALAAFYADGTAGLGDMKEQPAPPAAVPASVLAQNIAVMGASGDAVEATVDLLIRRALDIARGGNGKVEATELAPETEAEE